VGIEVTDDDYKSDTSKSVSWNSQDALAIYLDVRHLTGGSGVCSDITTPKYMIDSIMRGRAIQWNMRSNSPHQVNREGILRVPGH